MKNSKKCTTLLVLLGSALILQASPARAASNIENTEEKLSISTEDFIIEPQFKDILETTTTSAVTTTSLSATVTLNDLQNKINALVAKVEQDKKSGITFATEKLSELYLDASKVEGTLSKFELNIEAAKKLIQANSSDQEAITAAYNTIDTSYNSIRTLKTYSSFSGTDGEVWKDTNGVPIQAHGGQVQWLEKEGKWYWYGEDKTKGYRSNGISAYSSKDLYNWTFEGYVMRTISSREQLDKDPYFSELYKDYTSKEKDNVYLCFNDSTAVIERPKMIYNQKTGKYVLWFHADGPTVESPNSNYAAASAGVAISDSPNGPFKFLGRYRLNVCPAADKKGEWYEASAGFARDMNLWIDDDGTAYIIYSSEENRTMFISKLNDEYTYLATDVDKAVKGKDFVRLFPGAQREAPALFKYNSKYYMITSSATGWDPNQAKYWVADDILGEWTDMGDPCIDDKDKKTFYTQSTNVINVDKDGGKFIYMGDRWKSNNLGDSRYVWLPLEFDSKGNLLIKPYTNWKLEDLNNKYSIQVNSELKDVYTGIEELPKTLNIKVNENGKWINKDTAVKWNLPDLTPMSKTTVTGVLEAVGRQINVNVINIPNNLQYYVDCGAKKGSTTYELANSKAKLKNSKEWDKAYAEGSWGYVGKIGTDINYKNSDSTDDYDNGFWAYKDKKIEYVVPLKAGNYSLFAGFNEWWGANRTMGVSISYKNSNGETVKQELGTFTSNSKKNVKYTFNLPIDTEVKISVYKPNVNNPDVILSWFALQENR
ncbi:glycosyl hydrolases family 43 [Clostridium puniceum]|uniref:Glycosyl hydrolases family 43 n=1 Tax=Clostridium puniceum TaxID=29367 RepID=A0A1S8T786_9CLOT|nr:glycoside hydrolase family 43 protein [Clostridium puniceum]OOM73532.1 glycosyl hydrolases family 43 [Clostridium puniceum]